MKSILHAAHLFEMKTISDPQISSNGKWVVYVVSETVLKEDKKLTNLWLVPTDGSTPPKQLTQSGKDSNPRFAPDDQTILFTSSRGEKGKSQFYTISIQGGEAALIGTEVSPSGAALFSPDGSKVAFISNQPVPEGPRYPGEPKELYDRGGKEEKKDAPLVIEEMAYRADGKGYIHHTYPQIYILEWQNPDHTCLPHTQGKERIGQMVWNSDGSALYYSVTKYDSNRVVNLTEVRLLPLASGLNQKVLDFDGTLSQMVVVDDGKGLLWLGSDNSYPSGVSPSRLWYAPLNQSLPLASEHITCLTPLDDGMRSNLRFNPKSGQIMHVRAWKGSNAISVVPYANGEIDDEHPAVEGALAMVNSMEIAQDGTMVFLSEDFTHPAELFVAKEGKARVLTHVHKAFLEKYPPLPVERFTYEGADGWPIDGFLVRPLDYTPGQPVPTVLSIHGGPTGVYTDSYQFPFQLFANHGFAVVFTNPRGSVTYGADFAMGCVQDLGGKDYEDIMKGVDHVIQMGVADANRLMVTGWSYGGFMTSWVVTQTKRFKAAVAGAIISNWLTLALVSDAQVYGEGLHGGFVVDDIPTVMSRSPITFVRQVETPTLILHGSSDVRCPQDQSEQFYYALKRLGKETVYVKYPDQYHGFVKPTYIVDRWQRTLAWFKSHLA